MREVQKVSLYVPCYNAQGYINKCLEAALRQSYPVDEILVINDGSTDDTAAVASRYPVRIIAGEYNNGLASARNTALRQARNNFIASIDADCVIGRDWLKECMKNFDSPKVAMVGGRLEEAYDSNIADCWRSAHLKHHWGEENITNPVFLSGSNLVMRKDLVGLAGVYDERRYRNNYEDVDLSLRVRRLGLDLVYEPAAQAMHIRRDTIISALETFWKWKFPDYKKKYLVRPVFNLVKSLKLIFHDLSHGKFKLIFMDIFAFLICTYCDFRLSLRKVQ